VGDASLPAAPRQGPSAEERGKFRLLPALPVPPCNLSAAAMYSAACAGTTVTGPSRC
jgi:hypothetical protein